MKILIMIIIIIIIFFLLFIVIFNDIMITIIYLFIILFLLFNIIYTLLYIEELVYVNLLGGGTWIWPKNIMVKVLFSPVNLFILVRCKSLKFSYSLPYNY